MSQHDMTLDNGPGVVFRSDANAAIQALASQSSGPAAPSPTFPCQVWADTGTGRMRQRNAENSAWLDRGALDAALRDASADGAYAADTGAANAYVCNFVPAITVRSESTPIRFKAANGNTGASTINDGVGTVALVGGAHSALQGGEISPNGIAWIQWNTSIGGGSYVLLFCTGAAHQVANASKSQHAVSAGQLVTQDRIAFTTAGTAPAFTLSPSPPLTAYVANQRFRVKFSAAAPASGTLNVSGLGGKNLKQYDAAGAKVAAIIAGNQLADVEFDGTDMVVLDPLPVAVVSQVGIQGAFKKLAGSATGLSAVTTYSADEIIVESPANQYQTLRAVNITPSIALSGKNGLDTGTSVASTWYSVWVIWNGSTTAGLLSLSATAPTMPAGYTHKARVGWIRTDATAKKYPLGFTQNGNKIQYKTAVGSNLVTLPLMASGAGGTYSASTPTWAAVSVSNFVPSTAEIVSINISRAMGGGGGQAVQVAPNTSYGGLSSANPPFFDQSNTAQWGNVSISMTLESTSIYWACSGVGGAIGCVGWEDNL